MVAILLPAAGVARRRLDMAVGIRANPHVGPGRRDRQRVQPFPGVQVTDARPVRRVVDPPRPATAPTDAVNAVRDVAEPGAGRRLAMLVGPRRGHGPILPQKSGLSILCCATRPGSTAPVTTHRSPRCRLGTDLARPDPGSRATTAERPSRRTRGRAPASRQEWGVRAVLCL